MFNILITNLEIVKKIILNTVFISIPEEIYLVMFTLILMGEFDYWKEEECKKLFNSWDYPRILIPSVISALVSNIFRYTGLNFGFISFIPLMLCFILIVLTNEVLNDASAVKWIIKAFLIFMLGFIILGTTELIYFPFVVYNTSWTVEEITDHIGMNFLVSLPSRSIQYSILIYFIVRTRTASKGKFLKHIYSNQFLSVMFSLYTAFNAFFVFLFYKVVTYDKILVNCDRGLQIGIILCIILFPIINISVLIAAIYYLNDTSLKKNNELSQQLHALLDDISIYIDNGKYGDIKQKLNEMETFIDNMTNNPDDNKN